MATPFRERGEECEQYYCNQITIIIYDIDEKVYESFASYVYTKYYVRSLSIFSLNHHISAQSVGSYFISRAGLFCMCKHCFLWCLFTVRQIISYHVWMKNDTCLYIHFCRASFISHVNITLQLYDLRRTSLRILVSEMISFLKMNQNNRNNHVNNHLCQIVSVYSCGSHFWAFYV